MISELDIQKFDKINDGNIEKIAKEYLEKFGKTKANLEKEQYDKLLGKKKKLNDNELKEPENKETPPKVENETKL